MKTKISIIFLVVTAITILAGGIYIYYKGISPKGKAIGVIEAPKAEIKEIDKVFRLADINNDKLAEIILLKKLDNDIGSILILDEKGNLFDGWPNAGKNPAIGDVNNDGYKEIIDIVNNNIHIYDQFGAELPEFPFTPDNKSRSFQQDIKSHWDNSTPSSSSLQDMGFSEKGRDKPTTYPMLSDLDKDGFLEIIYGSNEPRPAINIIRGDASMQPGWPKELVAPSSITSPDAGGLLSIAAGDINNDRDIEIAALGLKRIFVFNSKGELISRTEELPFPEEIKADNQKLILADFDLDKEMEIVLVYGNEVSVRKAGGEIVNKINIKMENNISSLIVGDLNGDDLPEIILTMPDRKIYVYSNKGILLTGWPIDNTIGKPVIGDINSDGINELITIKKPYDKYEIAAYDINGKSVNGWPITLDYAVNSTLALCDIDDDRLVEIVFADTEDNIRIIKTAGIVTIGTWPEDNGNSYNNNVWENKYMVIDRERGITNKNEVISEASSIIPEFTKPEFKLLVPGKNLPVEKPEISPEKGVETEEKIPSDAEAEKFKNMNEAMVQDWEALGKAADKIKVMAYDYSNINTKAGPIAPLEWINDLKDFALTKIDPKKLTMGVPFYGYDWSEKNNINRTWVQIQDIISVNNITPEWDNISKEPYFNYLDENADSHTVYYENNESIKYKLELFNKAGIKGISICQIGSEDPKNWEVIEEIQRGKE